MAINQFLSRIYLKKHILGPGTPQTDYRSVKNIYPPQADLRAVAKAMAGTHTTLYNIRVYYTHLLCFLTDLCLALKPNLSF